MPSRNILVTGATGLMGSALMALLPQSGWNPIPLRRTTSASATPNSPSWDPAKRQFHWDNPLPLHAVIHLSGASIAQRWTPTARAEIRSSRVEATRFLCHVLQELPQPSKTILCASAIGYYGDRGDEILTETSPVGVGFLPELCLDWEQAANQAASAGIRVVNLRFGMVLSPAGGALGAMLPLFRLGLGGRLGNGRQYWSWITLADAIKAILFILENDAMRGPVNLVSPAPLTNREFTRHLGAALHRPACLPAPSFALRALLGDMASALLLASARAHPAQLIAHQFSFQHPTLNTALPSLLAPPLNQTHPHMA